MTQIIEEGNFIPSTEYTISGTNVTTAQITSPSSGNWIIPAISRTARDVKLEIGDTATDFEIENYTTAFARCRRYYRQWNDSDTGTGDYTAIATGAVNNSNDELDVFIEFGIEMRIVPDFIYDTTNDFWVNSDGSAGVFGFSESWLNRNGGLLNIDTDTFWGGAAGTLMLDDDGWCAFDAEI